MSFKGLSDEELVDLIIERLNDDGRVKCDCLRIECVHGKPILLGRVGSDEELQALEEILNEELELSEYENNVWVDDTLAFANGEANPSSDTSPDEDDDGLETDRTFEPDDEDEES